MDIYYTGKDVFYNYKYLGVTENEYKTCLTNGLQYLLNLGIIKECTDSMSDFNKGNHYFSVPDSFVDSMLVFKDKKGRKCFDCLNNAEQIMCLVGYQQYLIPDENVYSCIPNNNNKDTYYYIGDKDDNPSHDSNYLNRNNVLRAIQQLKIPCDNNVIPAVGNAYFICVVNDYPYTVGYHAAAVLHKYDGYIYTLETWGETNRWWFGRYSTNSSSNDTFHKKYLTNCDSKAKYNTVEIKFLGDKVPK